jgi:group I intron endonuclease
MKYNQYYNGQMKDLPTASCVYRIIFKNGCFYIGSTKNLRNRVAVFIHSLRTQKRNCNKNIVDRCLNVKISNIEIMEMVSDTSDLKTREDFYIKKFFNNDKILNRSMSAFSNKGVKWDERDKNRKGLPLSMEVRRKMSESKTPELRLIMSNHMKKRISNPEAMAKNKEWWRKINESKGILPIKHFNPEGELIAVYENLKQAALHTGKCSSTIRKVLDIKNEAIYGHTFHKANMDETLFISKNVKIAPPVKIKYYKGKPQKKCASNIEDIFIDVKSGKSLTEISKIYNVAPNTIKNRLLEHYPSYKEEICSIRKPYKFIINLETGIFYTTEELSILIGKRRSEISRMLLEVRSKNKTSFKYA